MRILSPMGRIPQWFCEVDKGGGGSSAPTTPSALPREEPAELVARYGGDALRLAGDLVERERDNFALREKNRDLRRENETLKQAVPEGALVLSGEQAEQWQAFSQLNLPVPEIRAQLTAGQSAITERDVLVRAATLEEAAKLAGFKPGVLRLLAKDLAIEVREDETTTGNDQTGKQRRAYVVSRDEGSDNRGNGSETLTDLREYFRAQGEDVLSSLEVGEAPYSTNTWSGAANASAPNPHYSHPHSSQGGTPYPAQGAGGGAAGVPRPVNRYAHNMKTI